VFGSLGEREPQQSSPQILEAATDPHAAVQPQQTQKKASAQTSNISDEG